MRPSVTFVASHMTPKLGLEKAVASLVVSLASELEVTLVLAAEGSGDYEFPCPAVRTVRLGGALRGSKRIGTIWRIRRWQRTADCDVVVGCGAWTAIPLLVAAAGRRTPPIVVWEHSLSDRRVYADRRRLRVLRFAARLLYRRAARVVCVSETQMAELASVVPRTRLVTIANVATDVRGIQPDGHPETGRLLSVGGLTATKNHQLAIRALALLPGARLTIAGEGPLRTELSQLSDELGVSDRLELVGYRDDLHALYAASQVVVHPSLGETFGYVLFEAAEHDRPVVVLDTPWAREVVPVRVPGRISAGSTPEAFAAAVRAAMASPPTAHERDQARRARHALSSSAAVTAHWVSLFGDLTDPPTARDL